MLPTTAFAEDPAKYDGRRLDLRDPDFIRQAMPALELLYRYWFRVDAAGFERIPAGPALVVGNHSGGVMGFDAAMTLHAWLMHRGVEEPAYGLAHPFAFQTPYLNVHAQKMGAILAHPKMAMKAFEQGAVVLVYPGGGDDAYRPFRLRNRIQIGSNRTYLKLALRCNVPVVPVVTQGAHNSLIVLDDGRKLAKDLGLDRWKIERLPISLSWPYGLTLGVLPFIPFPTRMRIRVGEPILFNNSDRSPEAVDAYHLLVTTILQDMLDQLAASPEVR